MLRAAPRSKKEIKAHAHELPKEDNDKAKTRNVFPIICHPISSRSEPYTLVIRPISFSHSERLALLIPENLLRVSAANMAPLSHACAKSSHNVAQKAQLIAQDDTPFPKSKVVQVNGVCLLNDNIRKLHCTC